MAEDDLKGYRKAQRRACIITKIPIVSLHSGNFVSEQAK